ncbi:hypothetical protein APUTEX25_002489, partial [Auxenochlorella protothecoides]
RRSGGGPGRPERRRPGCAVPRLGRGRGRHLPGADDQPEPRQHGGGQPPRRRAAGSEPARPGDAGGARVRWWRGDRGRGERGPGHCCSWRGNPADVSSRRRRRGAERGHPRPVCIDLPTTGKRPGQLHARRVGAAAGRDAAAVARWRAAGCAPRPCGPRGGGAAQLR